MLLNRARRGALVASTLVAFAATGCSSTVQVTRTITVPADGAAAVGGEGSSSGAVGGSTTTTEGQAFGGSGGSTGAVAGGAGGVGTTAGGTSTGPGGAPAAGGSSGGAAALAKSGRGWDAKYVYIGVTTQKDAQAAFGNA